MFSVYESADGNDYRKIPAITDFQGMVNYESGINFLLMLDNSGSMYEDINGHLPKTETDKKMYHAKQALISFLMSVKNPKDTVGLAVYNSNYMLYSGLTDNKAKIGSYLDKIVQPEPENAFTEIYSSVYLGIDEFSRIKGRKVIIVLSDGKNMPYYQFTHKPHKIFGTRLFEYGEPAKYCQEEGISVYAINFGPKDDSKDQGLSKIALQTGGAVFDASDPKELVDIYSSIVNQILNEYMISYPATMTPADKKFVRVDCDSQNGMASASRFYFSSTVFGIPLKSFSAVLILPFLLALVLLWILSRIRFEKKKSEPNIEVLSPGTAKAVTKMFTLNKSAKTVIGGAASADMTFTGGATQLKEKHATIAFDNTNKKYTIVADGNLKVNNKNVKTKILEPGDVITVGDSTIVFDDGEVGKTGK
jgi:Ca-activated chloride channel homolog